MRRNKGIYSFFFFSKVFDVGDGDSDEVPGPAEWPPGPGPRPRPGRDSDDDHDNAISVGSRLGASVSRATGIDNLKCVLR